MDEQQACLTGGLEKKPPLVGLCAHKTVYNKSSA